MKILGLSFGFHDSAAALLIDGVIVAAAQEERFTRIKHDAEFPRRSIDFCLEQAGLSPSDIDRIVYYENALKKFDRIVWASLDARPLATAGRPRANTLLAALSRTLGKADRNGGSEIPPYLATVTHSWFKWDKFDVLGRIAKELAVPVDKVVNVDHHDSHLAAAYYTSGFDHAAIVTMDGVGEYESAVIAVGRGSDIERKLSVDLPHSVGLLYSAFTAFLGFEVNEGEYKVMGMAAFGKPTVADEVRKLVTYGSGGRFELDQSCFEFLTPSSLPYTEEFVRRFGPSRVPESPFAVEAADLPEATSPAEVTVILEKSRHYADIAASIQLVTEEIILHLVDAAVSFAGTRNVCLAGGVALNSLANGRLIRERGYALSIHPAAGDAGNAIGAAASYHHRHANLPRMTAFASPYLGSQSDESEILRAIARSGFDKVSVCASDDDLAGTVAEMISKGAVVGWMQGHAEWGPRALGNRSILADPTNPNMKRIVNERVKFRELFRPFAPAVTSESATKYFDFKLDDRTGAPEFYMLAVHPVREEMKRVIPAVTHADGSARVQIVTLQSNPRFYTLLKAFEARSGVPILMNTSFNLRGEPVVDSPFDALRTFSISGIDYLVMGRHIISSLVEL